jgi:protein TonB
MVIKIEKLFMKTISLLFLIIGLLVNNPIQSFAQKGNTYRKEDVFLVAEQMPEYPGGDEAMNKFIYNNIKHPSGKENSKLVGLTYVQFEVDTLGRVTKVAIPKPSNPDLDSAALTVCRKMPKWIPGKQDGKKVRVMCVIPIQFVVEKPKKRYVH